MDRDLEAGRRVGRYMVHRRIASGGMATVHLGRLIGAAGFSRMVAIKRLHDGYACDPEFDAMLLDEARLASVIRHPNVVPTLDVVAEEDELLVVMEYVEGESLASLTKLALAAGERMPVPLAASIVAQTLHGLHGAHEARDKNGTPLGIVHRDVSPHNVLVGIDGVARVLDFGIAKAASRSASTEGGQLKGKTAYMAPEQLQHRPVDRRTDVFAAAILLWELLTGRRLFRGDTSTETMACILNDPIDSPQRWAPEVPLELAAITLRGLERDSDGRFASAEEMALAIEDAIALPRAKEIGAWVGRIAASALAERADLVRAVQRDSIPAPDASTTDPELRAALEEAERRRQFSEIPTDVGRPAHSSGEVQAQWAMTASAPRVTARSDTRTPVSLGEEPTDLATIRASSDFVAADGRRGSRAPVLFGIGVGVALAAAVAIAVIATRGSGAPVSATAPPPAVAMPPEPSPAPPAPSASAVAPFATSTASAVPAPAAASASALTKKRRLPRGGGQVKRGGLASDGSPRPIAK